MKKSPFSLDGNIPARLYKPFIELITDATEHMVYVSDVPGQSIVYMNERIREIIDLPELDLHNGVAEPFGELIHPEDRSKRIEQWKDLTNRGNEKSFSTELRIRLKNGNYGNFMLEEKPLGRKRNGSVTYILGITRQIKKESSKKGPSPGQEIDFPQYPEFVNTVFQMLPDIVFVMDLDTTQYLYANRRLSLELGYTAVQIAAMKNTATEILHPEDVGPILDHLRRMKKAKDGEVFQVEYRLKNANGGYSWFVDRNTVFKRNNKGVPVEKIGIAHNITARKYKDEQIHKQLNILQQTESLDSIGSWEYSAQPEKFTWSEGMYRLFEIKPGTPVVPEIYVDYSTEADLKVARKITSSIRNISPAFEHVMRIDVNGKIKTIVVKAEPLRNQPTMQATMIGVDHDITAQKMADEKIQELNKSLLVKNKELEFLNSELNTFNTIAANDYKDTLRKLYTCLEFIVTNDAKNLSNESKANLRRGQADIQKMHLLTDDIISYSKIDFRESELSELDLSETISEVIKDMSEKIDGINIQVASDNMPRIHGHARLIRLMFRHLIDNAIKFRNEKAAPAIKIDHDESNPTIDGNNKIKPAGQYVRIVISDNGSGFDEPEPNHLFTLFYRSHDRHKYKGSGIGLAIAKKIMDIHEGFISAESVNGNGTTISCYFPVTTTNAK